ncbi:MAG: type II toxin-antitoxin system PemK/MazF family toxin [bacterium]|nr:type II toxin-antitoxin system PemK/MazF family toxin [bacterium]
MEKDFDGWNKIKKETHEMQPRLYTVREIWWCRLGMNVGTEQDGKGEWYDRPCVIMRGFGPDACLVVPLTTSTREHPLRVHIGLVEGQEARANLSQIRVIDTRRLVEKVGFLEKKVFAELRKAVRDLFSDGFSDSLPLAGVRPKPTIQS